MKGDFSRFTDDPKKHYSGVLKQQGRVDLDADWNEEIAIRHHLSRTTRRDVIGLCGVPSGADGFKIEVADDTQNLLISPGRIYVDGILCELERGTTLSALGVDAVASSVSVPLWCPDGVAFEVHQWVELSAAGVGVALFRISGADSQGKVLGLEQVEANPPLALSDFPATSTRLRRLTSYMTQPDYPLPDTAGLTPVGGQTDLVYLDVWERGISVLEDPSIREVALGGADTTTRVRTIWQVKVKESPASDWSPPPPGGARLTTTCIPAEDVQDPCLLAPSSGYQGLENRLYRVEVHHGGHPYCWPRPQGLVQTAVSETVTGSETDEWRLTIPAGEFWGQGEILEVFSPDNDTSGAGVLARIADVDTATTDVVVLTVEADLTSRAAYDDLQIRRVASFKWSRDNASVAYGVTNVSEDGMTLTLSEPGKDQTLALHESEWIEVLEDTAVLHGKPGTLAEITATDTANRTITLSKTVTAPAEAKSVKVIRWDQRSDAVACEIGKPLDLEDGIRIEFAGEDFRTSDYWTFAARAVAGTVDPLEEAEPHGIIHHYCPLAEIEWGDGVPTIVDRRALFDPLTVLSDQIRFFHVGGTGQEVMPLPGEDLAELPKPIQVGVTRDGVPIEGAWVRFVPIDGGELQADAVVGTYPDGIVVETDATGVAACEWCLDSGSAPAATQEVIATLWTADVGGVAVPGVPSLSFNANLSVASQVAVDPLTGCSPSPPTVQAALHQLCGRASPHAPYTALRYISGNGQAGLEGDELPIPLTVGIENHLGLPAAGWVRFTIQDSSGGDLSPDGSTWPSPSVQSIEVEAAGIGEVHWKLGAFANGFQRVVAELLDTDGGTPTGALPVHFYATKPTADGTPPDDGAVVILPDGDVDAATFLNSGVSVAFLQAVDPATVTRFTFLVTFELAEGGADQNEFGVYGFKLFRALGTVQADADSATFTVIPENLDRMNTMIFATLSNYYGGKDPSGENLPRYICCRVTLKGRDIFTLEDPPKPIGNGDFESRFLIGPIAPAVYG